jgi:hypothetical protein
MAALAYRKIAFRRRRSSSSPLPPSCTLENGAHLHRRPRATTRGRNTACCQCPCHSAKRLDPAGLDFPYDRQHVGCITCGRRLVALNGTLPSVGELGVAELFCPAPCTLIRSPRRRAAGGTKIRRHAAGDRDVARSEGEDLADPETALACLQVFALGGREGEADGERPLPVPRAFDKLSGVRDDER